MPQKSKTDTHPKNNLFEIGVRFVPVPACSSELQIRWNGIWGFAPPLIEPIRDSDAGIVVSDRACDIRRVMGVVVAAYIVNYLILKAI